MWLGQYLMTETLKIKGKNTGRECSRINYQWHTLLIKGSAWVCGPQKMAYKHHIDPMTSPYSISLLESIQTKQTEPPPPLLTQMGAFPVSPWFNSQLPHACVYPERRAGCPAGDAGLGGAGLMASGYCGNSEGTGRGAKGRGGSDGVTTATDEVPSSPGLEMQLPLYKITCLVLGRFRHSISRMLMLSSYHHLFILTLLFLVRKWICMGYKVFSSTQGAPIIIFFHGSQIVAEFLFILFNKV